MNKRNEKEQKLGLPRTLNFKEECQRQNRIKDETNLNEVAKKNHRWNRSKLKEEPRL